MPISLQGSRSWSCVRLSLSDPPSPPPRNPLPAPMEGVHSRRLSTNLPPASLLILLFTLTSHLLSSPPPATMPLYPHSHAHPTPVATTHGQGETCEAWGGPECPPTLSPRHCASRVPGIRNGGGCGTLGSLPPTTTWYPLQCCHSNQDRAPKEERERKRREKESLKEGAREPGVAREESTQQTG